MTPQQVKQARLRLGLTQRGLAVALRLSRAEDHGRRTVRYWETEPENGGKPISGPAQVAIELMIEKKMCEDQNSPCNGN